MTSTMTLDLLQRTVGEWGDRTFPTSSEQTVVTHLNREVQELVITVWTPPETATVQTVQEEAADCLLLLLHLAHKGGWSLWDAAVTKHDVNLGREWGEADADGVVEHVRRDQ